MNKEYVNMINNMTYDECVKYLQDKYGKPTGNYFLTESCKSVNNKIKRTKDGLFIHHTAEYHPDYIDIQDLSKPNFASKYPFKFQTSDWLCYCNYIEHMILHYHINKMRSSDMMDAIIDDGLVHHILPELKYWFERDTIPHEIKGTWRENIYNAIKDDRDIFDMVYNKFYDEYPECPIYKYAFDMGYVPIERK